MIGTEAEGGDRRWDVHAGTGFIYLAVDDAAAAFERAHGAGAALRLRARVARLRRAAEFSLRDREGNIWSVGEYDPSRAP